MKQLLTLCSGLFLTFNFAYSQYCEDQNRFSDMEVFTPLQISSDLDVTYGNAVNNDGQNQSLELDFFYPDTTIDNLSKKPFLLAIHGGSFVAGDKTHLHYECTKMAQRGFVVASLEYRLGFDQLNPLDRFNAIYRAEQDAHAAMRFIVENADQYQIDTAWLFIGGGSAGAVTALNVNYATQAEWNSVNPGISTSLGGLYTSGNNLTNAFTLKGIYNNWGSTTSFSLNPDEMIPTISFHGDADDVVDIDTSNIGVEVFGSRAIHVELDNNNVCNDLTIEVGGGHGIYTNAEGTAFRTGKAACFFKSVICGYCSSQTTTDYLPANCSTTGIETNDLTNPLQVYPNPFDNQILIDGLSGNESFQLHNSQGKLIYKGRAIQEVDFSYLPNGMYFLKVEKNGTFDCFKLVKD